MEFIILLIIFFVVTGVARPYLQQNAIGQIVLLVRDASLNVILGIASAIFGMLTGKRMQLGGSGGGGGSSGGGGGGSLFSGFGGFWKSLTSGMGGAKDITTMLKDCPFSEGQTFLSDKGIQALLGWTAEGYPVYFELSDDPPHSFLGGKSGSGKSNLVHVLIHGLLNRYSPSELELYILDCKEGTEFNDYAVNPVPQIKLVTLDSNVEYGLSVLEYLNGEIKRRGAEFKSAGAKDIQQYRETGRQMPRIVLIIDEFQKLFDARRDISEKVTKEFTNLFKQGRSFGVHVLLATQSLMGLGEYIHPFRTQLACRIALSCSDDDSRQILSDSNLDAVKLIPKKEAIINNQNGQPSANCKFDVPYADPAIRKQHLRDISAQLKKMGYPVDTKVFDGANLPKLGGVLDLLN